MQTRLDVAKTLSIGELCESHGQILIPAGKPAQPAVAWQMLGDQARSASDGYQSYENFYNSLTSVGFAEAPTAVDGKTVQATLRFATKAGAESVERYQFTVVPGPDGKLVMSSFAKG